MSNSTVSINKKLFWAVIILVIALFWILGQEWEKARFRVSELEYQVENLESSLNVLEIELTFRFDLQMGEKKVRIEIERWKDDSAGVNCLDEIFIVTVYDDTGVLLERYDYKLLDSTDDKEE